MIYAFVGWLLALVGTPLILAVARGMRAETFSLVPRLALWALAIACFAIGWYAVPDGSREMALRWPSWMTGALGLGGTIVVTAGAPLINLVQRLLRGTPVSASAHFTRVASLSVTYRLFLVLTAAVAEEVLYRGYAVGIGAGIIGGVWTAGALSVLVFTVGHFKWGLSHLLPVFWGGSCLTLLFIAFHDLLACMLAHFILDVVGLVLAPMVIERRAAALRSRT